MTEIQSEVENKYVAARKDANEAKNDLEQLQSEQQSSKQREANANATIKTLKEEKSVLDRQLVEAKKELRKANEEKDGAEKRCLQAMNELEQTKRTSFFKHSVCKMCHIAIHSFKDNSRASLKKSKA